MSGNGFVQVPPNSTGAEIDCSSLSVGGQVVMRQRVVLGDPTHSANFATVSSGSLQVLVENTVTIGGAVSLAAGTSKIGFLQKISASVTVQGNVGLNAGTNHVGEVNISLMPAVVLAAGAAHIGEVNISLMPQVSVLNVAGTAHMGEVNISLMPAVVLAAGAANIGTINNISAAVGLAAGAQHIGEVNVSLMPALVVTSITNAINISAFPALAAGNNTVGAVTVAGFIDPSGNQRNVVDSSNLALRVNVVAGGAGGGIASGPVAVGGSATAGNFPVLMGGVDGGSLVRNLRVDANGNLIINNISATVNVAGSFTVGGQTGGASATAGSTYTLVGGMDGSIGRVALTDAAGHFVVTGTVALAAGAANIGTINNISAGVVLAAGAANIGTINNISAGVVLAAGAANIGSINNISAAVALAAGTQHVGEVNISLMPAVVLAAGTANIGTLNNISAAVGLAAGTQHIGEVNISLMPTVNVNLAAQSAGFTVAVSLGTAVVLAAGAANIGTINNISATVKCGGRVKTSASSTAADGVTNPLWVDKNGRQVVVINHPSLPPSASHGPKVVFVSSSASIALLPAQGSGIQNYVDSLVVTNGSGTLTQWIAYEVSATATPNCGAYLAASGGGFVHKFDPPWRVSANTVLNMRVKPAASKVMVTIHFHVGVD